MTVKEMRKLIEDEHTFVLIDSASCAEVFSEKIANDSPYPNVVSSRWKRFERYSECEVIGIRSHSDDEIALYINAPSRHFHTYLEVEYSINIELDVPFGEDEDKALAKYAREKLSRLPKSFTINGDVWDYSFDNMDSGCFYDCIEER